MIEVRQCRLAGLMELHPRRLDDQRGYFSETWRDEWSGQIGFNARFVQDNQSFSRSAGVIRGLHFQRDPCAQDKLVRVLSGAIFDVAVDIRPDSPTYGQWEGVELSADQGNQLFIPRGFAHGFMTTKPDTAVAYKVSAPYAPDCERSIRFDDPVIGIDWPAIGGEFVLSDKDRAAPLLSEIADAR